MNGALGGKGGTPSRLWLDEQIYFDEGGASELGLSVILTPVADEQPPVESHDAEFGLMTFVTGGKAMSMEELKAQTAENTENEAKPEPTIEDWRELGSAEANIWTITPPGGKPMSLDEHHRMK
jgi:hypothetical protein